jgi:FlaA1/EpsC-like NDP-sugar epimerase
MLLHDKSVLVIGGTGSLGKRLVRRLLSAENGMPRRVIVLSRDEAKQHYMRLDFESLARQATEEVVFNNYRRVLTFRIGDVRDFRSVTSALQDVDLVFNTAALKQVPTCEYFPSEAVATNVLGAENIVRAIQTFNLRVGTVIGISTDKACKPVNVMGMTKALQERVFITGNLGCPNTRFLCVRYGNVLASRGSVIPLFRQQIAKGGPVTITSPEMTRFLLSLDRAVDTILAAVDQGKPGEIFIPRVGAARVVDVAEALMGSRKVDIQVTGIRPGEKLHEVLVSEEEGQRTHVHSDDYFVIEPMLPELRDSSTERALPAVAEYSSRDDLLDRAQIEALLARNGLLGNGPDEFEADA